MEDEMMGNQGKRSQFKSKGMNMVNDGERITLKLGDYPQLADYEIDHEISGNFEGKIGSKDNDNITINFEKFELNTENQADKALKEMIGREPNEKEGGSDNTSIDKEEDY